MNQQELQDLFASLAPWTNQGSLGEPEWDEHLRVAAIVQVADPGIVETAIDRFMREAVHAEFQGYEEESKLFLLLRVVFDLPESAPESERFSFKGWTNWPPPDPQGNVSLSWPVSWSGGRPRLVAAYEGSEGPPYAAVREYRYLRDRFPYRQL